MFKSPLPVIKYVSLKFRNFPKYKEPCCLEISDISERSITQSDVLHCSTCVGSLQVFFANIAKETTLTRYFDTSFFKLYDHKQRNINFYCDFWMKTFL